MPTDGTLDLGLSVHSEAAHTLFAEHQRPLLDHHGGVAHTWMRDGVPDVLLVDVSRRPVPPTRLGFPLQAARYRKVVQAAEQVRVREIDDDEGQRRASRPEPPPGPTRARSTSTAP